VPKIEQFDRKEALEKALEVFWEKGYQGTSIKDLEERMALARSSIYNTFGDKEELFFQALSHYQHLQQALAGASLLRASSPLEGIRFLLEGLALESMKDKGRKGCFVVNATTELANQHAGLNDLVVRNKDANLVLLEDLIRKAQAASEIPLDKNPAGLATFLFSSIQGLRVSAMLLEREKDLTDIINHTVKALTAAN